MVLPKVNNTMCLKCLPALKCAYRDPTVSSVVLLKQQILDFTQEETMCTLLSKSVLYCSSYKDFTVNCHFMIIPMNR